MAGATGGRCAFWNKSTPAAILLINGRDPGDGEVLSFCFHFVDGADGGFAWLVRCRRAELFVPSVRIGPEEADVLGRQPEPAQDGERSRRTYLHCGTEACTTPPRGALSPSRADDGRGSLGSLGSSRCRCARPGNGGSEPAAKQRRRAEDSPERLEGRSRRCHAPRSGRIALRRGPETTGLWLVQLWGIASPPLLFAAPEPAARTPCMLPLGGPRPPPWAS